MGRYQEFILSLLKDIMTPGYWYSIDEINGSLLDLRTKSNKKYMQLPSKHSLAQQMCRFFKSDILVKKYKNRNIYTMLVFEEPDLTEVRKINEACNLPLGTMPHEWTTNKNDAAFALWVEYVSPDDDEDEFEIWV